MRSKTTLLRRSGVALYNVANELDWFPTMIIQAGVGHYCKETEVFKEAWPNAELVGFEPHLETFKLIQDHPGYPGTLYNKALGRHKQTVDLFWKPGHMDGASVYASASEIDDLKQIEVEMDTLDNCFCGKAIDQTLLWLDCEGSELDVLIGAEGSIHYVDVVNVELTGKPPRYGWPEPWKVNRWLLDHDFVLQYIHTQRTSSGQVDAIYVRPKLFKPEYCCCPLMVEEWRKEHGA